MLLAALPATPVQLAHACYQLGFEIVVPASWGDELVSHAVLEDLRHRDREPVIQCTCPLVFERLLANGQHLLPAMVQTASPAVAAARYARQAFAPRDLNITYIGACPGARHASIDERCVPDELLRSFAEHDVSISDMPTVFDSVLPPDRRRFVSLPGGCPTQEALWQASDGRMLREVTQPTFSTDLAQTLVWREHVMVDVAPSLGCACAGSCSRLGARSGRVAVMAVEPPRATQPVVSFRPDYAAPPVLASAQPELANGDTPPTPTARPRDDSAEQVIEQPTEREQQGVGAHASRARARVRTTTPLPRAYLAKRRHLGSSAMPEAAQPDVDLPIVSEPSAAAFESHVAAVEHHTAVMDHPAASSAAVPEPLMVPNETVSESGEVNRPIAVHVEPAPASTQEGTDLSSELDGANVQVEIPAEMQGLLLDESLSPEESSSPETAATATLTEAKEWAPSADIAPAPHEPVEEPELIEDRGGGPLRVEVEIFEHEPEPSATEEVVIADAVLSEDALEETVAHTEISARVQTSWGDLLIALWLVLVASAVIAALLWRR